ncbi:MAG TPA: preprotein translocase subunit SecY [Candidatus Eisenbacteria bacterium]
MFDRIGEFFTSFRNALSIPELRKRLIFTGLVLVVYRMGSHIPIPGINGDALSALVRQAGNGVFGLYDMFAGGNLSKATIFALGIMPYISASIILQLFGAVIPYFEKLQKEGEEGRKKINQYTRWGTVFLAAIEAAGASFFLQSSGFTGPDGQPIVSHSGPGFVMMTVITLTAGTMFVMWLGEQITERGIGNGISLIIFIGIVARYPLDIMNTLRSEAATGWNFLKFVKLGFILALMLAVIMATILITQGQRKIPVQYAKRMVGRKMYGGQNTHIPLRVNTAGVMPIIFAQALVSIPGTIASFFRTNEFASSIAQIFAPHHAVYLILYSLAIIFFTYFYTAIVLNPVDLADNMRKHGGFVPGIRPGKKTAEYIDRILTRITVPGAIFLAFIAVLPDVMINLLRVPFYFGGTGLLIVVGVALDTLAQIESHMLMRHYDGFMKKGRLKARFGR